MQRNKEQQDLLRKFDSEAVKEAQYIQGQLDGSLYMVGGQTTIISDYKKQSTPHNEENPHY